MKTFFTLISIHLLFFSYAQSLELELITNNINSPVEIKHAGDERLFVVEQAGQIKIIQSSGNVNATPFLNITNLISSGGERGLLGLAFSPNYQEDGYFYVNYTNNNQDTVIARYSVSSNPNIANNNGEILLTVEQPFSNHNGGDIHFGPDGYLYISLGDGGYFGDPNNYSQNKNSLLGKMLRIDVSTNQYSIPEDNPFINQEDSANEIWSYGLRNAWKFAFDNTENNIWIADVGQGEIEEINKVSISSSGDNYGWRCYEGNQSYNTSGCENASTMTFPIATYDHSNGRCSITGGYVYRGTEYPNLAGKYLFADYCSNEIGMIDESNTLTWLGEFPNIYMTTFGKDINNEMYVAGSNALYKIKDTSLSTTNINTIKPNIAPNPTTDYLTISNLENIDYINIYNATGKLMNKITTIKNNQISLQKYKPGIYLIQIHSANQINTYKIYKE